MEHTLDKQRIRLLTRSPFWAIQPEAVVLLLRLTSAWARGESIEAEVAGRPRVQGKGAAKMAVIPIHGVLTKDGPAWFGSNYESITEAAEKAANDPDVKHIVLSVDSPGGEVTGLPETAEVLAQVGKVKPVSAIVEGTSASAAYWLTSQAGHVTLTPSGEVGSVGVRMMHVDISKLLENEGFKVTELYSGDFKTEWSPYKPLSAEAMADMQPRLNATHQDFLNAVRKGRGGRAAEIGAQRYGEGRMFSATDALKHGLVDKLQSPREFYRAIMPSQEEDATRSPFGFQRARLDLEKARL